MHRSLTALIGAALFGNSAVAAPRLSPEAELADELKDRVAGVPVSCINLSNVRSVRIVDRTAIIYDAGRVLYVNRPRAGARSLDRWDTLVTRLHSSRLCRPEVVYLYDSASRFETGAVFLGDFIPYRRVR